VLNSIFAFGSPAPQRIFDLPAEEAVGFVGAQNMFYATTGAIRSIASSPTVEGDGVILDADPGFVDAATGNLRPTAGSLAFGRASFVPEVKRDVSGACRTERDIGAY
jgi:hypothetical protein